MRILEQGMIAQLLSMAIGEGDVDRLRLQVGSSRIILAGFGRGMKNVGLQCDRLLQILQ